MIVARNRRCLCDGNLGQCWTARCECGVWLSKHDFTEADAASAGRHSIETGEHRCRVTEAERAQQTLAGM